MGASEVRVVDNPEQLQYELWLGKTRAGFLAYRREPRAVLLIHAEVDPAFEGRRLGFRLVAGAIDDLRSRGLKLVPVCPFVASYLRLHPEHEDLLLEDPAAGD